MLICVNCVETEKLGETVGEVAASEEDLAERSIFTDQLMETT